MLTAPRLDRLINILKNRDLNPEGYSLTVKDDINKLYDLFDKIEPIGDDEYKVLYISVERGTIEDYGDFEDLKMEGEFETYEEFEKCYKEDYPDDIYWYKITTSRYKNYRAISINSNNIIYADMGLERNDFLEYHICEILGLLIEKIEEIIKMLENNTYNDYISNNLSYKARFGVIKRSDYWNLYLEEKKSLLEDISQEEIDFFVKSANSKVNNRIKHMTSGKYFECVRLAYENNHYELENLTDKELYLKYADGRDEGLRELNEDSSLEFDNWFNDKSHHGGHPWEIMRGHSFARVNLYVAHDEDGYYLSLDGSKILRKVEIAKIYLALTKNNIPIEIYNVNTLKDAFLGNDYIGIVPDYVLPIECGGYFENYKPTEFTHLKEEMFEYINWEPLEKLSLKSKQTN